MQIFRSHALQNPLPVSLQSQLLRHDQLRRYRPSPASLKLVAQFNLQHSLLISTPPGPFQLRSCISHAHPKGVAAFLDWIRAYAFLTPWWIFPLDELQQLIALLLQLFCIQLPFLSTLGSWRFQEIGHE